MLNQQIKQIVSAYSGREWVLEPDAKKIMQLAGFDVPQAIVTRDVEKADAFLRESASSVVIKAVSRQIVHKTDYGAVVTDIQDPNVLKEQMNRLLSLPGCKSVLVEEMVQGLEIIAGAKNDYQFGPVMVFGTGGTGVEIYNDTTIRMAPLKPSDVISMVDSLKADKIIKGYRGKPGVNLEQLTNLMVPFSHLVMELEDVIESIDLNPVICTRDKCVIADARIILTNQA